MIAGVREVMTTQRVIKFKHGAAWPWLVPSGLLIVATLVYPVFLGVATSFTDSDFMTQLSGNVRFVGFANYISLFSDPNYIASLYRTLAWVVTIVAFQLFIGLMVALLLNQDFAGKKIFYTLILLPWAVPGFVAAMTWRNMYSQDFGIINYILGMADIIGRKVPWLADPSLALGALMVVAIWRGLPFAIVTLLAALKGIDPQLHEAAEVDGASFLQRLSLITLPMLRRPIGIVAMLAAVTAANQFEIIFINTRGGPARATEILPIHIYLSSFQLFETAHGAAVATMFLVVLSAFAAMFIRLSGVLRD